MAGEGQGRLWIALAVLGLILGACGGDDDEDAVAADDVAAVEDTTSDDTESTLDATVADSEASLGVTAVPSAPLADEALPGEVFDLFPEEGAAMVVVGVAADDVLNVRVGPGTEYDIVTTLAPTSDGDAVATGRNRSVDSGIWAELQVGDLVGWANTTYLLQSGMVVDDTASLYRTAGDHPIDPSLTTLGREVAQAYGSIDPSSTITVVDGPTDGDLPTITLDVLGLGDDAVGGYRVTVLAEPMQGGFRVRTVEATTLCTRGVADGLCV